MENDSVRQSRAGDAFHYRWAARRCLKMVSDNSSLEAIYIEGSKHSHLSGEYSMDTSEYHEDGKIEYFQLKHSSEDSKRATTNFPFSEMKETLLRFSKRYIEHKTDPIFVNSPLPRFFFITNREISKEVKEGIPKIGTRPPTPFSKKFTKAIPLKPKQLKEFCNLIELVDSEGDFNQQRYDLCCDAQQLLAGDIDDNEVDGLIALVGNRALPSEQKKGEKGKIIAEDVLQRLGVTSSKTLFPAPSMLEALPDAIKREKFDDLKDSICRHPHPTVVEATGGNGKSILSTQLAQCAKETGFAVIYDCFANGHYRNQSQSRHRASDALVQIVNELATEGLCKKLIPRGNDSDKHLFGAFMERLKQACSLIKKRSAEGHLFIIVDAADNAEMAAKEFEDRCFAKTLLRENFPENCKLVMLCRPERRHLLSPANRIQILELPAFSKPETLNHLRCYFATALEDDALELHQLTNGNPRVQAMALNASGQTLAEILRDFGPSGMSVEDQIESQLESALAHLKDQYPETTAKQIDNICRGLASLPPFIPKDILAEASGVSPETITSFISELGRPIRDSGDSVQFKDEPTESWFRKKFIVNIDQRKSYCTVIQRLAEQSPYAARALPSLLLQSESYSDLVSLALSEGALPTDNSIEARDIRVYRLQFAFKAAIRLDHKVDASKLALRAGEEVAGNSRQRKLLEKNIGIISETQSPHRIQELAFSSEFKAGWPGSENIFSASLLSTRPEFRGDARSYLRGASNWLHLLMEKKRENKDSEESDRGPGISPSEMAEMSLAYLNLFGVRRAARFLTGFRPDSFILQVSSLLFERLVDLARFTEINQLARLGSKKTALVLAACHELAKVAKFPPLKSLRRTLAHLDQEDFTIEDSRPDYHSEKTAHPSLLSFCEAAAHHSLSSEKIIRILEKNTPERSDDWVIHEINGRRRIFFQSVALKSALLGNFQPATKELLPILKEKKARHLETGKNELTQTVETLLPWFALRAHLIAGIKPPEEMNPKQFPQANRDYWGNGYSHSFRGLPFEISRIHSEIITLSEQSAPEKFATFHSHILRHKGKYFRLSDAINFLRAAFRCEHLKSIREPLEQECASYQGAVSKSIDNSDPESDAQDLVDIAIAVLPVSLADASVYFEQAVELISKFGDEIVERWTTTQNIADRASSSKNSTFSLCERFFRCAEVVSESVAREKHWDRCETFSVGTKLNYISAFSTWSRWRDRQLHSYRPTLLTVITTALKNGSIPASAAWSLTGFEECNTDGEFHALCIREEAGNRASEIMTTQAEKDLELADVSFEEFQALGKETSTNYDHRNRETKKTPTIAEPKSDWEIESDEKKQVYTIELEQALASSFPTDSAALSQLIDDNKIDPSSQDREILFEVLIKSTPLGSESSVLEMILHSDRLDFYSLSPIIFLIRTRWLQKAAIKKQWPNFIKGLAKRFTERFAHAFHWGWSYSGLEFYDSEKSWIQEGVSEGLSENPHSHDASTFFAFVSHAITAIPPDDALELLEYSLSRFELHIPDDFGEGPITSKHDSLSPLSGLIWSALGSPSSAERWQAAHCVTRLASLACQEEIDQLILRLKSKMVGLYGSQKQVFFSLHAKLYLLIALDRIAIETPLIARPHSALLAEIALAAPAHILIQKTAANICLKISSAFPTEYSSAKTTQLRQVGKSQLPPRDRKSSEGFINSPWHENGNLKNAKKPSFENDFGWYWFDELRDIFGIHQDQIEDLARDFALGEIGLTFEGDYDHPSDGREHHYYDSTSRRANSSHSHGSYPHTDDYSFYYSYHSFLHAGALLLNKVPVTFSPHNDYETDRWDHWLSSHSLTRKDGFWLSDRRDPNPLRRRKWVSESSSNTWRYELQSEDFFDALVEQCPDDDSIFVSGSWGDVSNGHIEDIRIRSVLVTPQTSESLASHLRNQRSPYDFAMSRYRDDDDGDFDTPPFEMIGWITSNDGHDSRLDKFDPYSGEISYPPIRIGDDFAKLLNISADQEHRFWNAPESESPGAFTEIWNAQGDEQHKRYREGHRMQVKKSLLMELCKKTGKDLLFCVQIGRSTSHSHYSYRSDEEKISLVPSFKIFILSHDGILRDSRQRHSIG